jgi:hypothetical protein
VNLFINRFYNAKFQCLPPVQGIAGLDCWIAQSGLQSSLVDWIVIDNQKSKSDLGFGLSIQFLHFNPNPKAIIFLIKKPKTHG